MAIVYEVTRFNSLSGNAASYQTFARAPAAAKALRQAVYDMLEANGLLDRPVAYRLINEAESCEVSPPPRGHLRQQRIKLDEYNSVEFYATRA